MVLKRVGPMSIAKINGALGVLVGLLIGIMFAAFGSMIATLGNSSGDAPAAGIVGAVMGVGAIVILPICYGLFMFVIGLIYAVLYNWLAGMVGGIEVDIS